MTSVFTVVDCEYDTVAHLMRAGKEMFMKVLISTDTSCLCSYDVFNNYDISLFPLNIIIDGKEYLDGVTIKQDEVKEAMRAGRSIKTSTPPLGEVIEYFEKLLEKGYDHIIHFTISGKLSSMNELFTNVAKQNFDGKVTVIDSNAVSFIMLSQVFTAYDIIASGGSVEDVVKANKEREEGYVCFIPENLTALKNGGRISPTIALIGNTIGIKPVIIMKDGALEKEGMTRRVRKTIMEKIDEKKNEFSTDKFDYTLVVFDVEQEKIDYIKNYIKEVLGVDAIIGSIPVNVCAHCGPGTVGLVVAPRINGKSVTEFIG